MQLGPLGLGLQRSTPRDDDQTQWMLSLSGFGFSVGSNTGRAVAMLGSKLVHMYMRLIQLLPVDHDELLFVHLGNEGLCAW